VRIHVVRTFNFVADKALILLEINDGAKHSTTEANASNHLTVYLKWQRDEAIYLLQWLIVCVDNVQASKLNPKLPICVNFPQIFIKNCQKLTAAFRWSYLSQAAQTHPHHDVHFL
jgi:hypothetical protein